MSDMFKKMTPEEIELGSWMSAALEDESACAEFKTSINAWFAMIQARASAPQAALTQKQRSALKLAIAALERDDWGGPAKIVRTFLEEQS